MNQGLILSFITAIVWAADVVLARYIVAPLGADPLIFATASIFVSSGVLVIIAGPGTGGIATIKSPHTWAYGLLQILMGITEILSFIFITSTESSLLGRMAIAISLIGAWVFLNRRPTGFDILGALVVLAGVGYVTVNLESGVRIAALVCMFFTALFSVTRTLIAETHPESLLAHSVKDRCRVTGYVLAVTSFALTAVFLLIALLQKQADMPQQMFHFFSLFPRVEDFYHLPTLAGSLVFGATLFPLGAYYYFYAAKVAKTEVLVMVLAFMPLFTFLFEGLAATFGFLDVSSITWQDALAGAIIIFGAVFMLIMRQKKEKTS